MEIVRQRRKRLLAWILTLVLCVGMWQGNVQAEGEDGGDGALTSPEVMSTEVPPAEVPPTEAEPTEGGDESANPVVASETGDGDMPGASAGTSVSLHVIDPNFGEIEPGYNFTVANTSFIQGETGVSYECTELNPENKASIVGGEGHNHNFFGWYRDLKNRTPLTGTITTGDAYAMFGRSVKFIFWETGDSSGRSEERKDFEENINDAEWAIETPVIENKNSEDGAFLAWMINDSWVALGNSITGEYIEFELEIEVYPNYTNNILGKGKYPLMTNCQYIYKGDADFTVSKDNKGDGYTYNIGQDTDIYVDQTGEYTFN